MSILRDFHVHTSFSDGTNTPEEVVRTAILGGMTEIGFSDHSPTPFDPSYCMSAESCTVYRREILRLKELYSDAIAVRLGIEQDYYTEEPTDDYEYVIGSVHYLCFDEKEAARGGGEDWPEGFHRYRGSVYVPVDESADLLVRAAEVFTDGDVYALAERYFMTVSDVVRKTGCAIIGHFDLISKHNEKAPFFDESDERYVRAWKRAADALLETGIPFEINTGAMSRGAKTDPYPSRPIREYLASRGARFILSSDSHRADTVLFAFDRYEDWATVNRIPDEADPYIGPDAPDGR